jgi:hypothetical protein
MIARLSGAYYSAVDGLDFLAPVDVGLSDTHFHRVND